MKDEFIWLVISDSRIPYAFNNFSDTVTMANSLTTEKSISEVYVIRLRTKTLKWDGTEVVHYKGRQSKLTAKEAEQRATEELNRENKKVLDNFFAKV